MLARANVWSRCASNGWMVLLCLVLVECSGSGSSIRRTPEQSQRCVYVPRRDGAAGTRKEAVEAPRAGMRVVLVTAPAGTVPVEPLVPRSATPLQELLGEGLGDGVPRGVLQLVPEGGPVAEAGAGVTAGEVVVGGAVVAAIGSGLLVCLTAKAATSGEKTPIDTADEYYGTHFGDMKGWVQGQYPGMAPPPLGAPGLKPDEKVGKHLGRIYVTYTKLNKMTQHYYVGRTSMIFDSTQSRALQEALAVLLRDKNHHMDENSEPKGTMFADATVDVSDIGTAIAYRQRYVDVAYGRIRGREQQLMDSLGGAQSDTGEPYQTENVVRGVAKDNPRGRLFHDAATEFWGQLFPYTGH